MRPGVLRDTGSGDRGDLGVVSSLSLPTTDVFFDFFNTEANRFMAEIVNGRMRKGKGWTGGGETGEDG
jgi:hypothetical protein